MGTVWAQMWAQAVFENLEIGPKPLALNGGRYWARTSDIFDVNETLYRLS